jgi:glycerol-1-phosphate dehydrogenase [NAD(P)+]
VRKAFGQLNTSIADECWSDCAKKIALIEKNWVHFVSIVENWKQHCVEFSEMVQPSEVLRPALKASGAPATFDALNPSISPDLARWAVAHCHLMRNRFNLVDLLDLLGLWNDEMIDWVLA